MQLVIKVAQTNATVLITGESGSGKELVARAIHHYSLRCTKPWVDLNCGALPEHLIESELFGYEKGAFSGADSMKPGLFEAATTGTLFLDEIGELDIKTQVKLLRVLDGVPYYRLGGTRKVTVDVRIVAATNVDLEEAIHAGRFRADLFHRLSPHSNPCSCAARTARRHRPARRLFPAAARSAPAFFGGRYRSVAAPFLAGQRARTAQRGDPGGHLQLRRRDRRRRPAARNCGQADAGFQSRRHGGSYSLDGLEQHTIFKVLEQTGGHQQKAAEILGISRRTLIRKLKLYRGVPCQSVA